jgi:hypothetical protein
MNLHSRILLDHQEGLQLIIHNVANLLQIRSGVTKRTYSRKNYFTKSQNLSLSVSIVDYDLHTFLV